jgi:hypothetical protein
MGKGKGIKPIHFEPDDDCNEESEYGKWLKENSRACTIIYRTCGPDAQRTIQSTEDAAQAWTLLQNRYEGKGFFLIDQHYHEFKALSYDKSKDIATFNALFKDLKAKIDDAGMKLPPAFYVINYLSWVGPSYPTWAERARSLLRRSGTQRMPSEQDLDDMLSDLVDENRSLSAQQDSGTGISMYGNKPQNRKGNAKKQQNGQKKQGSDRHCNHCDKNGHLEQDCYIKHPEKKEEYIKQRKANANAKNENTIPNANATTSAKQISMMATQAKSIKSSDWILDTGASHHMCNDRNMFDEYRVNTNPAKTIATASGDTRAEGYGTVRITAIQTDNTTMVIVLQHVFHMPSLGVNLLSGPTMKKKGFYIDGLTNTIRHEEDQSEICKFQSLDSAMRICTVIEAQGRAMVAAAQSIDVWHRRLGHIGLENVRKTAQITKGIEIRLKNGPKIEKPTCKPCLISKAVRTQSKQPQKRCEHAFDKIHADLLGPITPIGIDGSKWAMILTDDYSRIWWLYTFPKKGDAQAKMKEFITAVHTQYGKYPKAFRLDNGTEYGGNAFKRYCVERGIRIELTVPYTPEQDGVSERSNRTILERTRTLIRALEDETLKNLWPEFMRTAIYLTNRLAT